MSLEAAWADARVRIDDGLAGLLAEEPAPLRDALEPALVGGKRLRPVIVLWVHAALGGAGPARALQHALGLELLHTATLVHDDLIDGDAERRGRPALHARFGPPLAALAGDAAVAWGLSLLDEPWAAQRARETLREVWLGAWLEARGGGEHADVAALKTASLFRLAAELGAHAAGAETSAAARYGHHVGLAYQLADDLADAPAAAPPKALLRASAATHAALAREAARGLGGGPARSWLEALPGALVDAPAMPVRGAP